jgi:hypothetical protein
MASFDRKKCTKPINGPEARSGKLCPEGWTLYKFPHCGIERMLAALATADHPSLSPAFIRQRMSGAPSRAFDPLLAPMPSEFLMAAALVARSAVPRMR